MKPWEVSRGEGLCTCVDGEGVRCEVCRLRAKVKRLREALEAMMYDVTPVDGYPSAAAVERARAALKETEP